ncbi:MAG: hypothetical protein AAB011_03580 [Candidatus Eisenbacteria bacterium]
MAETSIPSTPRLAIIGAGPIGLEAALEGSRRGFDVQAYDSGRLAEQMRRFGWVTLFTPFAMNSSEWGRARLRETGAELPADDAILSSKEFVTRYLDPLSRLPELAGRVREHSRVSHIGREGVSKSVAIMAAGDRSRRGRKFLLRVEPGGEAPRFERADVVIDATGVYGTPRATGPGGLPALGEEEMAARIDRHLVPILGSARTGYAARRVLLVGDGYSAATALVEMAGLAALGEAPEVTWIRRGGVGPEPFLVQMGDPLPVRAELGARANQIARDATWLTTLPGGVIEAYAPARDAIRVTIREPGGAERAVDVDRALALVGYRPDSSLHRELQVHLCYASEGPMALASAILSESLTAPGAAGDCLKQTSHGAETLRTPEPGFFLAGAKSYGRNPHFLLSLGHRQIGEIFSLIEADLATEVGAGTR